MDIFGTKTPKNHFFRVKLLPKVIFWNFFTPNSSILEVFKIENSEKNLTFQPISKQTADEHKNVDGIDWPPIKVLPFG